MTNEGRKLTREILEELGWTKNFYLDRDGDEVKTWSNDSDVILYEDSWWLKELDEDENLLAEPISHYPKGEEPEISYAFATYVRGDGSFKGGYSIETDTQLKNLYFSLTNKMI